MSCRCPRLPSIPAKSVLLGMLLLLMTLPAAAQLVTITSAHMGAGYQPAGVVWTFCMQPTGVAHGGFQVGSTGQATGQPNCRDVEGGVILTTLGGVVIGPMMEPDTSLSAPLNVCLVATLRDVNGLQVLGGNDSGYGCVQPTANNSWCHSGTCNFDNYTPEIAALPPCLGNVPTLNGNNVWTGQNEFTEAPFSIQDTSPQYVAQNFWTVGGNDSSGHPHLGGIAIAPTIGVPDVVQAMAVTVYGQDGGATLEDLGVGPVAVTANGGGVSLGDTTGLPVTLISVLQLKVAVPFASLPVSPAGPMVAKISDATVNTWGAAITVGGGTYKVLAWYNGTNWTVLGI